jgi:hypothetical protein
MGEQIYCNGEDAARALHAAWNRWCRWYAGITNDPHVRLALHQVDPKSGNYDWVRCTSESVARDAADWLHALGYQGGPGGGQGDAEFVYIYLITEETREEG